MRRGHEGLSEGLRRSAQYCWRQEWMPGWERASCRHDCARGKVLILSRAHSRAVLLDSLDHAGSRSAMEYTNNMLRAFGSIPNTKHTRHTHRGPYIGTYTGTHTEG